MDRVRTRVAGSRTALAVAGRQRLGGRERDNSGACVCVYVRACAAMERCLMMPVDAREGCCPDRGAARPRDARLGYVVCLCPVSDSESESVWATGTTDIGRGAEDAHGLYSVSEYFEYAGEENRSRRSEAQKSETAIRPEITRATQI